MAGGAKISRKKTPIPKTSSVPLVTKLPRLNTLTNIREWFRVNVPEIGLVYDTTGGYHFMVWKGDGGGSGGSGVKNGKGKGKLNFSFDLKTPDSFKNSKVTDVEEYLDQTLKGFIKKPSKKGEGFRYCDGKGNSFQINYGYKNASDEVHGGPYFKATIGSEIIHMP